ncbi:MAG: Crp/Fnr family transcriptional regulator [Pseudomonadales bacterium]
MSFSPVSSASPLENDLLAALSPKVRQRLRPLLELFPLPLGKVLYESGDTMTHAYFPTDALVSLLYVMQDGASAEVSIVGKDGVVGIAQVMGGDTTPWTTVVQSQGWSFRLPIKSLLDEFHRHDEVMVVFLSYAQALVTQTSQTAACNRHHNLLQQLVRWLLLSLDRLPTNNLNMTQELIAHMLGVRREGVTAAAGKLKNLGLITYSRGHITVLDREGLERLACECYRAVRKETEHLIHNRKKLLEAVQRPTELRQNKSGGGLL